MFGERIYFLPLDFLRGQSGECGSISKGLALASICGAWNNEREPLD